MPPIETRSRHVSGTRVSVLLPLPLSGAYDYRVPEGMELGAGDFVTVPLGARIATGVVWGEGSGDVADKKLKEVLIRLETPPLPLESLRFVDWVSAYSLAPAGAVLKMVMSVPAALEPPKTINLYSLAGETGPDTGKLRMTPARLRVMEALSVMPSLTAADLVREAAVGPAVVKGMAEAGILAVREQAVSIEFPRPDVSLAGLELSADQVRAAVDLVGKVARKKFSVTLLDGVPGSGKTEVYFHAVAEALKQNRQVLVLLPEIALSAQWLSRFQARFGCEPAVWHSDLTASRRREIWRAVAEGRAHVVVGARSALFLPFADLGLIVIDEEHEAAFKQEEGVIYNARDMAVVRARLGGIPAIAVSATPSLETVSNVREGKYDGLHLADRHAGAALPEIEAVDLRAEKPSRGNWISPALRMAVESVLERGEQAMLYLNRRGYAPLTLCRTCGHRIECPRCSAWLVEHRFSSGGRMQCHHCGFASPLPDRCPECDAEDPFAACGPGVERLAEEATSLFPEARTVIAASDTLTGPNAAAEMVRRIEDHEVDLIIGTQIVAKGYHFPLLTLVGVVDADLGLAGGDLRAAERTFQLLYQVSGRAGRADKAGKVLLQTYMPEHPVMQALVSGDRDRFLEAEADARRTAGMPPFGRLAALIVS
ncbi:MAG: primosomal protein N', partial [Rhodospirillales bacterium]|nr:primosomal protein N' [Rhodospirillales bacterium]